MAKKRKVAASFTIYRAGEMTPKGRKAIVNWLKDNAKFLEKSGHNFAKRFTATYFYL